ncbi:hypothetical protein KSS87_009054 [Heliosperma pusillum]|nr:hypothetical protein KSS87_009054 [Heliosperma pusillum]
MSAKETSPSSQLIHGVQQSLNSCSQAVIDALSFELPKAIAKFAGVSQRLSELVESIIDVFTTKCSPRDMISVFSEALDSYGKTTDAPGYVAVFLHGVSKVFLSIQRRHFEQIKVAVPIILNALKAASFDLDDGDVGFEKLFEGAVAIAGSIQATCKKLEGEASLNVQSLLALYVLQVMAVASITMGTKESMCLSFVQQLSSFFPYCGLLYANLITGHGLDPINSRVCDGDTDDYMDCFSYVKHGAVLSVIWGHISDEVVQAARQELHLLKDELRSTQSSRWSAAITSLIMTAPSAELRKMAFTALKSVLADFPASLRLDMIQFLVRNSSSASMAAILLDFVRENLRNDYLKLKEAKFCTTNSFWNAAVLDLVEFILRPPCGGPPSLPDQTDAVQTYKVSSFFTRFGISVMSGFLQLFHKGTFELRSRALLSAELVDIAVLSALNLYRYVLITESTGKTNHTGVLSKSNLQKVYNEMLLPLRTVVTAVMSDTKSDGEQHGFDIMCGLNPVEFVLYRCIELVEDNLKQPV